MSVRTMAAAWQVDIPAGDKLVLLALADCANDEGGDCWPGIKSLCRKTGKQERSLQAAIQSLVVGGHITRHYVVGKGCRYTVHPQAFLPLNDPRKICTPAKSAPPQKMTQTPAKIAGKPSLTVSHKEANASFGQKSQRRPARKLLSKDWQPKPFGEGTTSASIVNGWTPDRLAAEAEAFRAYHTGQGTTWADWQQAWATWVLRTTNRTNGATNGHTDRTTAAATSAFGDPNQWSDDRPM